jgi:hypothetical protein
MAVMGNLIQGNEAVATPYKLYHSSSLMAESNIYWKYLETPVRPFVFNNRLFC